MYSGLTLVSCNSLPEPVFGPPSLHTSFPSSLPPSLPPYLTSSIASARLRWSS